MKKNVLVATSLLGVLLLSSYIYLSPLTRREKEVKTIEDPPYSYPRPANCAMWSTQPPPARVPRWIKQYNESCQRYSYLNFCQISGFGHKTDNFMNGLIFSSALNFTYAMADNFEPSSKHSSLAGVVDRLGLGAYSPMLNNISCAQKEVGYDNSLLNYEDIINRAKGLDECNTTFHVGQFYADDRSPVRWHMAHMVQSRLATARASTTYDKDKFNIAVHLRYGSFSPYKDIDSRLESFNSNSSNTIRMIKLFTKELEVIGVPYAVHFFTGGGIDEAILGEFPGSVVHGKEMPVVDTIQHFIESDLLFCLMSSMCHAASIMSTRPLVVNGYPTAEPFFYDPCSRGMFCDLLNRTSEPDLSLVKRVREAGERWLVSRRLNCPVVTEAWPEEDTSIPVSGPEQCDIWGPPLPPRMLFDPNPDTACPVYGYIPLDKEHSGSLGNTLRWIKGVALSNLLNVTFVFEGSSKALEEETALGLGDGLIRLHSLKKKRRLKTVDVPLVGVRSYNEALDRLENVEQKCNRIYRFEEPSISELGWAHLALAHMVQKHIIDTEWKPTLWTMDALNVVVDMSGEDDTLSMEWVFQGLDTIYEVLIRKENNRTKVNLIVIVNEESEIADETKAGFEKYGNISFVPKPKSVAEHVKHLVSASDLVFCPKVGSDECRIAALAGSRPGFVIRVENNDGVNFCAGANMCSLVLGDRPITETNIAFARGISERWIVGKFTGCL